MKKAISFLLALVLLLGVLPVGSHAADCTNGHSFGAWQRHLTQDCVVKYKRQCTRCHTTQQTKDIAARTLPYGNPAITASTGELVMLELYSVSFSETKVMTPQQLTWSSQDISITDGCILPTAAGVYKLTASAASTAKTVYLVVKNPEDTEYTLFFDDFSAASQGYRILEASGGAKYSVSDGKLFLDASGSKNSYLRMLLPAWIDEFGDYTITTRFNLTNAKDPSMWFAVMGRVQKDGVPYWQAPVREDAATENGVELALRNKNGSWSVSQQGTYTSALSPAETYTHSFSMEGTTASLSLNGAALLGSDAMTLIRGGVGFQVRGAIAAIHSVKVTIPSNDEIHLFGSWKTTIPYTCTMDGEESRMCANCRLTETRRVEAHHDITQVEEKMHTCTESGWLAHEACRNCRYSTLVEIPATGHSFDRSVLSIAHRGYSQGAPENTLHAFTLAKEKGFTYVECDVSFTADGVAVLLHDDSIDRTSNGKGKIASLTYAQVLEYDFGGWKDEKFKDTKIPTFEEFIALCAELELHPYIELKNSGGYTQEKVQQLVDIVNKHELGANSSWISFNATYLNYVKKADPTARLGFLKGSDVTESVISTAKGLKTDKNQVFLDIDHTELTNTGVLRAAESEIPLELYTINSDTLILTMPGYVTGVTSDVCVAERIMKDAAGVDEVCVVCLVTKGPELFSQPKDVQVKLGQQFRLSVQAEGKGLKYQWYYKNPGMEEFQPSKNTTNVYSYEMQRHMHQRQVYCLITDKFGNQVATDIATITRPAMELQLLSQPESVCVPLGKTATVKVDADGDGLSYQWYYKNPGMKEFQISKNKTYSYSYTMQNHMNGRQVYCVISDRYGNRITTDTVTINRPAMELALLRQPRNVEVAPEESFIIDPQVQGDGLTYHWYYQDATMADFAPSYCKAAAYSLTAKSYMDGRRVYCVITDQRGNSVTTQVVQIQISK